MDSTFAHGITIKSKFFSSGALVQWKEDSYTICAHVSGHGCKFSVKCRTCGLKTSNGVQLMHTLMSNWKEFKPCNHSI